MLNKTAFISMCSRDSAIWFSFTGLYHAFEKYNVDVDFFFPTSKELSEDEYNEQVFYYDLKRPLSTFLSIYRLSKEVNIKYSKVVIFSQGVFPAILTFLLRKDISKAFWVHEFGDYISRTGLLRGMNYYISDAYMKTRANHIIVSSREMVTRLSKSYNKEIITFSHLPLSGDFSCLLEKNDVMMSDLEKKIDKKTNSFHLVFFGGIAPYKGLDIIQGVLDEFNDDEIHLTILGRGDLSVVAPRLYKRFLDKRNVDWCDEFMDAKNVAAYLLSADFLYLYYTSVTATSLIDISNAFGLPVLCSRLSYFESRVTNLINGIIVDESELVPTLKKLINGKVVVSKENVVAHFKRFSVTSACVESLISSGII